MHRALCTLLIAGAATSATAAQPISGCDPVVNQKPICKFQNPEDLAPLPGGEALLVSEYGTLDGAHPGGIALLVLASEDRRTLFVHGDAKGMAAEGWGDPACPGPPSGFSPHGIDLAPRTDGKLALAAVQHGGRESIELFEVMGSGTSWKVEWRGCWIPPDGSWLNEVILLTDGSVMASHMMQRTNSENVMADAGPGWLLHWTPSNGFQKVAGSELRIANGFELSADEKTLYLNSTGGDGVRRIDRATGKVTGHAKLGALDNTTWAPDGTLLVAQLVVADAESFEVCEGLRAGACPIPFQIVAVDPESMETRVRFDSSGSPMGAGTVGLQVGSELFIGSFAGDRILRVDLSRSSHTP